MPEGLDWYQIDAFVEGPFSGNPAAVYALPRWLPDARLQAIAESHNLSETAFLVPCEAGTWRLRWFTPSTEVDLCGHATLAAAWALFEHQSPQADTLHFHTRSGVLHVERNGELLLMNFPALAPQPVASSLSARLGSALGVQPQQVLGNVDLLAILADETAVRTLAPDLHALTALECRGVIVSAPGDDVDFVSRFFAPRVGVDEDPVTGSAHCLLTPYWSARLARDELLARQLSRRGGWLRCTQRGDRVLLAGRCRLFATGRTFLPD